MAKIFISHAHDDGDAAHQITAALAAAGLEPWLDVQKLRSGEELLGTIAKVLTEVEYFAVVLTPRALTKRWVLTEMRMALTREIEHGRPKVVVLLLDDCEVPIELKHKIYLDFRGRFDAALKDLINHMTRVDQSIPTPKQTVLAEMITNADEELWARLSIGAGSRDKWEKNEVSSLIRGLQSAELEAAVAIGWVWSGKDYKMWESDILSTIRNATNANEVSARRILRKLADEGFLEEARDLDYRREPEPAWCDGSILWILRRAARRSGLFPALPPPIPERLSSLLAYERPLDITGKGWYAVKFAEPVKTALSDKELAIAAVSNQAQTPCTWAFRSPDDRSPLRADRYYPPTDLTPADPFALLAGGQRDLELVGFNLSLFDDLGLLRL